MRYNFVILQFKRKRTRNFNSTAHTFITRKDVSYILQPPIRLNFRQHKHYTELNTIHCQRPGRGLGTGRRKHSTIFFESISPRRFFFGPRTAWKNAVNIFSTHKTSRDTLGKDPDDYTTTPRPWISSIRQNLALFTHRVVCVKFVVEIKSEKKLEEALFLGRIRKCFWRNWSR